MMMGLVMRRRRGGVLLLRAASAWDGALFSTSAAQALAPSESGHVGELRAGSAGPCDSDVGRSGIGSALKRVKQSGGGGRPGVEMNPKAELIQDPRIMKLFNLAKARKFVELKAAHERLLKEGADSAEKGLDVYLYSRLMTQCVRHVGNETALPVFELMEHAGVTPNVVPYTIVIRALMGLADDEKLHHSGQQGLKGVAKSEALASKGLELLHEMRSRGIRPNELTYKPIMSWLPPRGRDAQFQQIKKFMAEDGVPFTGVFKFYEIRLALRVGDLKKAETLYIEAKKENHNIASSLDGMMRLPGGTWLTY